MGKEEFVKSILTEYGINWAVNRSLYSIKLKLLSRFSTTEKLFEPSERKTAVKRSDIFTADNQKLHDFLKKLSKVKKRNLTELADKAAKGIITGFSSVELDYGYPIDWQLNPLTQESCDITKKWFLIPDFDTKRGDIKIVWEASRLTHLLLFARAYLLTEDTKYFEAFSEQLAHWLKMNPYSYGCNYKCGQECALRMMSALLAFSIFKNAGLTTQSDEDNIKFLVSVCYRKILSNFFYAYRCIKNNHTISELIGMIIGAWCCDDQKQIKKAYKMLNKVIKEQFTSDGGYKQFSFNYQRFSLQVLVYLQSISDKTGIKLDIISSERVIKSAKLLYQVQDIKSGDIPNYGSNDGTLIFPLSSCGYRNFKPVINSVYAMFAGKCLYDTGDWDEELIWFSGTRRLIDIERIPQESVSFPEAGIHTLRKENMLAMIVLNNYKSRPAHMDQLHIDLWIDGVNVFCDIGTYSYTENRSSSFVLTEGHNTVKVCNLQQMEQHGQFMIYSWTKRTLLSSSKTEIEGEVNSKSGYTHNRKVTLTNDGCEITDTVSGSKHPWVARFHTPCEVIEHNGSIELLFDGKLICLVESAKFRIDMAERSLFYQNKDQIKCITVLSNGKQKIITKIITKNNGGNKT